MSRILLLIILATSGFAQGAPPQAPPRKGSPKIAMASFEHDLGEVKKSADVSHTFTFKNEGESDLVIKKVAPS